MVSSCGRYVICYNGEVYNAANIRSELSRTGVSFVGHSDTEVILESCASIGLRATVEKLIGMFAFALWDMRKKRLQIVRDRLGIKPLYWTFTNNNTLLFASELKALRRHPEFSKDIDRNSVSSFLRHNYVPSPNSIYRNVQKLNPGHILSISMEEEKPRLSCYWSLEKVYGQGRLNPFRGSDDEAIDMLDELLSSAVKSRMIADVPLGAFLSGGVDSSTVAALMQKQSDRPIKSFSIGFTEDSFNEAKYAKEIASYLGTDHTELYVTPEEALAVVPFLPKCFDEPFADSSQIPTYLVSAMTKKHVTVALSGDGGDELFAGYTRYMQAERMRRLAAVLPNTLRHWLGKIISAHSPSAWDALFSHLLLDKKLRNPGNKIHRVANALTENFDQTYLGMLSHWTDPDDIVLDGFEYKGVLWDEELESKVPDFLDRMQFKDILTYLPDDILTKVDRATMAVGLEARVPIIDHRIVEFSWRIPRKMKIRNGESKWLLKQVLNRYVPKELVDRPKMGFGVPLDAWLKGPLREWADDILTESNITKYGLVNPAPITKIWNEHKLGQGKWHYLLWDVIMLHAWAEENA